MASSRLRERIAGSSRATSSMGSPARGPANRHVAAGAGGGPYLEFPCGPPGWTSERRDLMLETPIEIDREGRLAVPLAPGIGIELSTGAQAAIDAARSLAGPS